MVCYQGKRAGQTITEQASEVLERENREFNQTNDVLCKASVYELFSAIIFLRLCMGRPWVLAMIFPIVLGVIAVLCAITVIYPYLLYSQILKHLPSLNVDHREGAWSSVTLVFCAFNEEHAIKEKIENIEMLKTRHPDIEVLAFDDGSTDATYDLLSSRPDLLTVVRVGGRNGKAHGMKLLVARALGDVLVFTDANVFLAPEALENLLAYYADETVGGVCGSLKYIGEDASSTAAVGSAYWKLEEYLKKEESRTGNVMGADGSIFSIRRALYPEFPDTVLDDLTVSMAVVFAGRRLIKVEDVVAFERLVTKRNEEFSRKVRISARAFHTHMYLTPQLKRMCAVDKFKYLSRKLVRWFGGLFLAVGAVSGVSAIALFSPIAVIGLTLVGAAIFYWGATSSKGVISLAVEIVIALVATLLGVFRAARGKTYAVWNPAKSR